VRSRALLLGMSNQPFSILPQFFGLGKRRINSLMLKQGNRKPFEKSFSLVGVSA
jgi:hypothetical protein